jgi:hypothetical protein
MFVNPKTGLPARPLAARQAAGGDGIAPVIVCLFDRERGTGTDSVVNLRRNTRIPLSWNASGVYYLLVERCFEIPPWRGLFPF